MIEAILKALPYIGVVGGITAIALIAHNFRSHR